jgi:NitT/TauT family transport system permease protein
LKKWIWFSSSIFILFLVWILVYQGVNHDLIMPSLKNVLLSVFDILSTKSSVLMILATLFRLCISILMALVFAILFGILAGLFKNVSTFLKPYITILRTVPVISITVILFILLGYEIAPFIITFLMVFPIVFQATEDGIKSIDNELIDVYKLEEHHLVIATKDLYFPLIKPYLFLSLLQSFGLGVKVLVMAEYLSQTKNSIGNALYLARINIEYQYVYAWTIVLILISLVFEFGLNQYRKKRNEK